MSLIQCAFKANYATDISTCFGNTKAFDDIFSSNIGDHTTLDHTCVISNIGPSGIQIRE